MEKNKLLQVTDWLLPPNFFRLLTMYRPRALLFAFGYKDILDRNKKFKNIHNGKRCFILCTGPSVNTQNILPLKNEIVFSVSRGHHHPDYKTIAPAYHCVPHFTFNEKFTNEVAIQWFTEMGDALVDCELFIDAQQYNLVKKNNLFSNKKVNYLCTARKYFYRHETKAPDITNIIPRSQSVPIMAIILALNMGFKEIYLLGTDHDWFVTKEYKYSYEAKTLKGLDPGVTADGKIELGLWDYLPTIKHLWSQYRSVKTIASNMGTTIYNASPGSMLDEFQHVKLEDILK